MKKRKLFIIKQNFHLKFIVGFVSMLAGSIAAATFCIYRYSSIIIEETAFSSHLYSSSTRELFWPVLWRVNLWAACISMFFGVLCLFVSHFYLERFFHSLANGINQLAQRNFSVRLPEKIMWRRALEKDFNTTARQMQKRSKVIQSLLGNGIKAVDAEDSNMTREIRAIHTKLRRIEQLS